MSYQSLVILNELYNEVESQYIKGLIMMLFKGLQSGDLRVNMEVLKLFDYEVIKGQYHIIRDIIDIILEYFNINKYELINTIRINNGFGYDRTYLNKLILDLSNNTNIIEVEQYNDYIKGLMNLFIDTNVVYNTIGLKIVIIKYLLNLKDLRLLKVIRINNNKLNDKYSHLALKGGKIKNNSKMFFTEHQDIILSTVEHDRITNIGLTVKNNLDYLYQDELRGQNINTELERINKKAFDVESQYKEFIIDLFKFLSFKKVVNFKPTFEDIEKHEYKYIHIIELNEVIFYPHDKIYNKFERVMNIFYNKENFESNDLTKDTIKKIESNDYYKYEINLNDYFLRP